MYKQRGYFYLCGLKGPEELVKKSMRDAFVKHGGLTQ